ncbi:MAG: YidH family protein [Fimbriimonadaceae bacterium]
MAQHRAQEPKIDPRTVFAAERTLLAWVRTGLSLMGFGFALARFGIFLREVATTGHPVASLHFSVAVGIILVAVGVLTNLFAVYQHVEVMRRLRAGENELPARISPASVLACALAVLGIGGCVYLLTLHA